MTQWKPIAYVALRDDQLRAAVDGALHEAGWATVHARTGMHLVGALSGLILGDTPWLEVGLVVVDEALPGCRGSTIARGLRDLGIDVPLAIVSSLDELGGVALDDPDRSVYLLEPRFAAVGAAAIARSRSIAAHHRALAPWADATRGGAGPGGAEPLDGRAA